MSGVLATLVKGLEQSLLMAYEVWWALRARLCDLGDRPDLGPAAANRGGARRLGLRAGGEGDRPRGRLLVVLLRGDRESPSAGSLPTSRASGERRAASEDQVPAATPAARPLPAGEQA